MDDKTYYEEKLNEIPKDFLDECVDLIQKEFPQELKNDISDRIETKGLIEWAIPYHHSWGVGVRNLLRENGLTDDKLPDENWDDYYIQVIELALGHR